ncbi:hypothetical protein [Chryseobacterium sp. WX]|uniref:hypothetical protein n=1 Tax=Chryseobacterium sp. WX TaxID=3031803 RepID=UPI0024092787|nr:hypothetical protein [Chryseobacterium sp. WX]WFB67054.1 hypothetical protein PZ898_20420 [Chryseobacterium sp. WX]
MKTVLKEFLELLKAETIEYYNIINNESNYHYEDVQSARTAVTDLENLLEKGNDFLEKEKKQIIEAVNKGISNWVMHDPERHGNHIPNGKDYYYSTFKNE